jgi:hypothetical protein
MIKILKSLKGHSNGKVLLIEEDGLIFVRKYGDIHRNLERYKELQDKISIPNILDETDEYYDMEYVSNLGIKKYISNYNLSFLVKFITETIDKLSQDTVMKDYTEVFRKKLNSFNFEKYDLPFTAEDLLSRLPKLIPQSTYHGDFTMDNILYSVTDHKFVMIDPLTTDYDSYIFDVAKLRQDITCKWFIRNDDVYYDYKLKVLSNKLKEYYDDNLLILMLLRVLPYTKTEKDAQFLIDEIKKLWK